ncbi:MAG TPA: NAD-glutamate dehydrogenase domain-containing protein, partial [Polyangiaceae bacterium]|nr:NAD-glutamate dehydrogenase domain-containing protein [Polyangiaceae bacterium]
SESDAQVGDRANDAHRINGNELGALVVGEGANLALTQRARIEYSLSGGRCNADFIDNSAGVDCSDHEVNIKILLGDVERHGGMTRPERNDLLREMTDDVAALVLRDNYLQSQTLSVTNMLTQHLTDRLARNMRALEKTGRASRRLDALPSDDELADRQRTGNGFVRPELCVLMAHAKNWLFEMLVGSDLPDSPLSRSDLLGYFPRTLTERFERYILAHRLRREITATVITNELINRVGVAFVGEVSEATGSSPAAVALGFMAAREIARVRELWSEIEALDNRVPSATQAELLVECSRLLERVTTWLLHEHGERAAHEHVESYRAGLAELSLDLPGMLSAEERSALQEKSGGWNQLGVPAPLAERIASLRYLLPAVDIVRVAELGGVGLVEASRLYSLIGARFGLQWLRSATQSLPTRRAWDRQAVAGLRDELFATQRAFTLAILRETPSDRDPSGRVNAWREARSGALLRWEQLLGELRASANLDFAMITVASRQLAGMIGAPAPVVATVAAPPRSTTSLRSAS